MSRRALILNSLLALVALACLGSIMSVVESSPGPPRTAARQTATILPPPRPAAGPAAPAPAYAVIATRNLFSPTRNEPIATAASAAMPLNVPKPNLFGVVVRDGAPIAYLEDPATKRVAGYRPGDSIAGAIVQTIFSDRVVIVRPEGPVDVLLHEPGKARTAPTPGPTPTPSRRLPPGPTDGTRR